MEKEKKTLRNKCSECNIALRDSIKELLTEIFQWNCATEPVLIPVFIPFSGRSKISNNKELGWICEERWKIAYVSDENQREWSEGVPPYQQRLLLHWQNNDILIWLSPWCQGMYCGKPWTLTKCLHDNVIEIPILVLCFIVKK